MGIKGIAKVAIGWFLGCEVGLDYSKVGKTVNSGGTLFTGGKLKQGCSAISFFNFMLNLAFLGDWTIEAATSKEDFILSLMTMLLTNGTLLGRVRLHFNLGILIACLSSMCFLFLLEGLDEAYSGIGAGSAEALAVIASFGWIPSFFASSRTPFDHLRLVYCMQPGSDTTYCSLLVSEQ
nr:hypothetical protein [Tanacetum cinerariifolium]